VKFSDFFAFFQLFIFFSPKSRSTLCSGGPLGQTLGLGIFTHFWHFPSASSPLRFGHKTGHSKALCSPPKQMHSVSIFCWNPPPLFTLLPAYAGGGSPPLSDTPTPPPPLIVFSGNFFFSSFPCSPSCFRTCFPPGSRQSGVILFSPLLFF